MNTHHKHPALFADDIALIATSVGERRVKVGYDLSRPGMEWEFAAELQAVDKRGRRLPKVLMAWGLGSSPGEAAVNCIEDIQKWLNSELALKFEDS